MIVRRRFVAYFWFVGWENISLGLSIDLLAPNVEIHVPCGFFRIGWDATRQYNNDQPGFGYGAPRWPCEDNIS